MICAKDPPLSWSVICGRCRICNSFFPQAEKAVLALENLAAKCWPGKNYGGMSYPEYSQKLAMAQTAYDSFKNGKEFHKFPETGMLMHNLLLYAENYQFNWRELVRLKTWTPTEVVIVPKLYEDVEKICDVFKAEKEQAEKGKKMPVSSPYSKL